MRMIVATHGNCLDGLASAALFTKLVRQVDPSVTEFQYRTCIYGPTPVFFGPQLLSGDSNAILDYRFYSGSELTWYFDHHTTAFSDRAEESVFQSRVGSGRYHFDPHSPSCAGLIARVARDQFGVSLEHLESLVAFADQVDSARYQSAAAALDRSQPRSRFLAVVERFGNDDFMGRTVESLLAMPIDEVAKLPESAEAFSVIEHEQTDFLDHVRGCSEDRGAVVVSDISDREHPTFAKFANYLLFPHSTYSVLLGRIPGALKIAAGFNPWGPRTRQHDLGSICRKFGGGGHPVVGGVAFAPNDTSGAKAVVKEIVQLLERHE
jgi:hypothetical protein